MWDSVKVSGVNRVVKKNSRGHPSDVFHGDKKRVSAKIGRCLKTRLALRIPQPPQEAFPLFSTSLHIFKFVILHLQFPFKGFQRKCEIGYSQVKMVI